MTTAGGEGDGEKSTCRCLDAARYVIAAAVTVLIMAVIVNAVKVVLRPESLRFSVAGGYVVAVPGEAQISLGLNIRALNPSGRARMYYVNSSAYLFYNNTSAYASSTPEDDSIFYFFFDEIALLQQERLDSFVSLNLTKNGQVEPAFFDLLYNGSCISDATLRLDGNLVTQVPISELNKTRRRTSYYCEQLLVGGDLKAGQDVICKQQGS